MSASPVRSRSQSVAAMLGICLVMLLIALDQTVVGTALPRVVAELQGFALYQWVASAYLLTTAVMIPIAGRLGDLHGRKGLVLAAIVLFTLASALCGMADSMLQLVLARGLQGIGGGMLAGTAFACVSDLFPEPLERVRWQAMLSASFGIATAMGPVLGGWLTEHLGWRSVFYVNLPVALLALPVVWIFLPHIVHRRADDAGIDWGGALLLTLSMCGLLLASEQGATLGFGNPLYWAIVVAAIVLCTIFVRHQRRSRAPVIPAHLFSTPAVRQLCVISALTGLAMFVLVFYAPLLLQGGFGFSPKMAGLLVTPLLVCVTIGSIINGRLMPRLAHPEKLISWGLLGLMAGCALLVTLEHDSPVAWLALVFGLCGLSLGFQLPNLTLQVQSAVTRQDTGIASALIQTNRTLGSMFGASLAGMLVNVRYGHEIGAALAGSGVTDARVTQLFDSPQLLVRAQDLQTLSALSHAGGFDAATLVEQARLGLVSGIHLAFAGCVLIAGISFAISRRLPPFADRRTDSPA
ncbi:MFS transporter [Microvirgula aerodenitrificans]|uniref:MFS transporter n=1 Tax=Microvirgula aerodenitrificans TaxID=57480 RepID=A0A2S0PAZ1_9NEIS|nr:MDR family MFS transporter [Microvirgula aerodenitrificans]AVY94549.1 MFS transporter [Microvirgula aerodenitrificans]